MGNTTDHTLSCSEFQIPDEKENANLIPESAESSDGTNDESATLQLPRRMIKIKNESVESDSDTKKEIDHLTEENLQMKKDNQNLFFLFLNYKQKN